MAVLAASGGGDDASQGYWLQGRCLICMGLPNYGPSRSNDVASSLAAQKGGQTRMGS